MSTKFLPALDGIWKTQWEGSTGERILGQGPPTDVVVVVRQQEASLVGSTAATQFGWPSMAGLRPFLIAVCLRLRESCPPPKSVKCNGIITGDFYYCCVSTSNAGAAAYLSAY